MIKLQRNPVISSNLESVGYDSNTSTLEIEFHSGLYEYYNVPQSIYNGLMAATSKGSYFHQNIKDVFSFKKLR